MSSRSLHSLCLSILVFLCFIISSCKDKPEGSSSESDMDESSESSYHNDKAGRPSPPARAESLISGTSVSIDYSQPAVKGRKIWGSLVKYDRIWRTGANEANVLETNGKININGKTIEAGKYALFTIPSKDEWVVIINNIYDQWGAYDYDKNEDVARLSIKPEVVEDLQERMQFTLDSLGNFSFAWEYLRLNMKIESIND